VRRGPSGALTVLPSTTAAGPKEGAGRIRSRHPDARPGQPGQGERRESATDVRLDGDEVAPDADDGDAGHFSGTYIDPLDPRRTFLMRTPSGCCLPAKVKSQDWAFAPLDPPPIHKCAAAHQGFILLRASFGEPVDGLEL
jgi:hypothetical protein